MLAPLSSPSQPQQPSHQLKNQTIFQVQQANPASNRPKALVLINPNNNNVIKRSTLSNERKIQTIDHDSFTIYGKQSQNNNASIGLNHFNAFQQGGSPHSFHQNGAQHNQTAQQILNSSNAGDSTPTTMHSPTSGVGTSNTSRTKQKLFNNLNNFSPKSPTANIYATIGSTPSSTTSAQNNSRHVKNTKLHSFFDQRRQTGPQNSPNHTSNNTAQQGQGLVTDLFKKARAITNENLQEHSMRGIHQKPYNQAQLSAAAAASTSIDIEVEQNNNNPDLSNILVETTQNNNAEFKKSLRAFQNQPNSLPQYQHQQQQQQQQQHHQQQQQQQIILSTSPKSRNNPYSSENQSNNNTNSISNNTSNLNSFITRVAKGEILGQSQNISSPMSMNSKQQQQNNYNKGQTQQGNPYQTLIPLSYNNQLQNQSSLSPLNSDPNTPQSNMQILFNKSPKESKTTRSKVPQLFLGSRVLKKSERATAGGPLTLEAIPSNAGNSSARNVSIKPSSKKAQTRSIVSQIRSVNSQRTSNNPNANLGNNNNNIRSLLKKETHTSMLDQSKRNLNDSAAMDIESPSFSSHSKGQRDNSEETFLHQSLKGPIISVAKNNPKPTTYYNPGMLNVLKNKNFMNIQSEGYFEQIYKEHFIQSFHSLHFCKNIKPVQPHILESKKVNLSIQPKYQGKKTIVFDLDETLIHCNESTDIPSDVIIPIKFPNNEIINAGINIRPFAKECLEELSKHFEIIVFTASHGCYAIKVLEELDPENKYISHRLFRESCVQTEEGVHIKDLRIFANRNLKDLVLVDNAAYSFSMQVHNGIPIVPYYHNKEDQELRHLSSYLLTNILESTDVREVNKQYFKMHMYSTVDKIELAAKKVYSI